MFSKAKGKPRGQRMNDLAEQVDDYIQTIIDGANDGRPSQLTHVTSYYRNELITLITEACVGEVEKIEPYLPTVNWHYEVVVKNEAIKAIRALSEVGE